MPRIQTVGAIDEQFHIYNRGVDKRKIFLDKNDYFRFYESLYFFNNVKPITNFSFAKSQNQKKKEKLVDIEAYCLLPNHFHLILLQRTKNGICEFMKRISGGYTRYFNEKNDRNGVLFQGVYKRVLITSDAQYNYLTAYVNENYSVHGLTNSSEDIIYSSLQHYSGKYKSKLLCSSVKDLKYDISANKKLAKEIFVKREILKHELFE